MVEDKPEVLDDLYHDWPLFDKKERGGIPLPLQLEFNKIKIAKDKEAKAKREAEEAASGVVKEVKVKDWRFYREDDEISPAELAMLKEKRNAMTVEEEKAAQIPMWMMMRLGPKPKKRAA